MEHKKKSKKKKAVQFKVETQENTDVDNAMKLFLVFEQGESGVLSFNEFNEAIHEIGLDPSSDQVKRLFNRVDSDGNGRIDFEEFLKLFLLVNKGKKKDSNKEDSDEPPAIDEERRKSLKLMKLFDTDGDGVLSVSEWQTVLNRMGMKCTSKEAKALFRNVDSNGDGKVDLDEFMTYLSK